MFPGLEGQAYFSQSIGFATLLGQAGEANTASNDGNPLIFTYDSEGVDANRELSYVLVMPGS